MDRPTCPSCGRLLIVVGTRPDEPFRVQYLGCRQCDHRHDSPQVVAMSNDRPRYGVPRQNLSSNFPRGAYAQ
jgi:C4-type Zn-finger protein